MDGFSLLAADQLLALLEQRAGQWEAAQVPEWVALAVLNELDGMRRCQDPVCLIQRLEVLQQLESLLPSADVTLIHALKGTLDSWLDLNLSS